MTPVRLNSKLIEGFTAFLSGSYDDVSPIAPFHREVWDLYCSDNPQCACAAPRGHAKSTALTLAYGLAVVLFREQSYVVLLGSSEDMAVESLGELVFELAENEDLIAEFGIKRFITQQKTDVIVECEDGYQFRIVARGAGQKIRGRKWRGKRPGLLLFDDVEDDEQVESAEQRAKFRRWFFRAAKQAVRLGGKVRGHGTILHEDSMLANLMKNSQWKCKLFKAHAGFDDFSNILWPQRYSKELLQSKRQELIEAGDAPGYSAEMLNDPLDNTNAYLRKTDFIPMSAEDFDEPKRICAGWDFAVSKADLANRTSVTIGGCDPSNRAHFLDFRVGRWSPTERPEDVAKGELGWIDVMFEVEDRWHPEVHFVEGGVIWKAVEHIVYTEMQVRGKWLNLEVLTPVKDKATRGRAFQKRHRAGATRWNTSAEGYEGAKEEMLRFTGGAASRLDDQFDSAATLCLGLERQPLVEDEDFDGEDEIEWKRHARPSNGGRSEVTGY